MLHDITIHDDCTQSGSIATACDICTTGSIPVGADHARIWIMTQRMPQGVSEERFAIVALPLELAPVPLLVLPPEESLA